MKVLFTQSSLTFCNPMDCSQSHLSTEFSRQECWGGLPFPPSGDLPDPRFEPRSPVLQADSLLSEPPGKPLAECLLLRRIALTNLDSVLNSRDITLPIKVHIIKAMVFQYSCMDVKVGP